MSLSTARKYTRKRMVAIVVLEMWQYLYEDSGTTGDI